MVIVEQSRDKDGQHFEQETLTFHDPLEALAYLAKYELGCGGQVIEISDQHIKVQTQIIQDLDTSIFKGTVEEMEPLIELVYFYQMAIEECGESIMAENVSMSDKIGGNPLLLSIMAPLIVGHNRMKVVVMLACGLRDKYDIESGLEAHIYDVIAAVQLSRDGECSFRDALAI